MGTWIEIYATSWFFIRIESRALMGTWIEILQISTNLNTISVVPSWARGLKYLIHDKCCYTVAVVPAKAV